MRVHNLSIAWHRIDVLVDWHRIDVLIVLSHHMLAIDLPYEVDILVVQALV